MSVSLSSNAGKFVAGVSLGLAFLLLVPTPLTTAWGAPVDVQAPPPQDQGFGPGPGDGGPGTDEPVGLTAADQEEDCPDQEGDPDDYDLILETVPDVRGLYQMRSGLAWHLFLSLVVR